MDADGSRQAFEEWWNGIHQTIGRVAAEGAWQAACEWQKRKDAEIARDCFVGWPFSGANQRLECANAIMFTSDFLTTAASPSSPRNPRGNPNDKESGVNICGGGGHNPPKKKESGVSDIERKKPRITEFGPCHDKVQEIESLHQRVIAFESLETKRMKDAVTAEDWKRIAEHLEYQYKCCSDGFNRTCGELRQRVATLTEERQWLLDDVAKLRGERNALRDELAALKSQQAAQGAGQGEPCAACGGTGRVLDGERCIFCGGTGEESSVVAPAIPEGWQLNAREIELLDGMITVQLSHAERCDEIHNRAMAEKQKGWDLERIALLRKCKAMLAAAPKPEE